MLQIQILLENRWKRVKKNVYQIAISIFISGNSGV
uniref:Uncharacterized protein n=1 Tax=Megaselia scalaris TaxID=36166 RepID=T1GS68_MEGSC